MSTRHPDDTNDDWLVDGIGCAIQTEIPLSRRLRELPRSTNGADLWQPGVFADVTIREIARIEREREQAFHLLDNLIHLSDRLVERIEELANAQIEKAPTDA